MNFLTSFLTVQFTFSCHCQITDLTSNKFKATTPAFKRLLNISQPINLKEKGLTFANLRTTSERTTSKITKKPKEILTTTRMTTETTETSEKTETSMIPITSTISLTTEMQATASSPIIQKSSEC